MAKPIVPTPRFVLFAMPRTGSNMLMSKLRSGDGVVCMSAIFSIKGWKTRAQLKRGAKIGTLKRLSALPAKYDSRERRVDEMESLLGDLIALYPEHSTFGFKQHFSGPRHVATKKTVELGWPAIILTRNNLLAAYSSNKIVKLTGQGNLRAGESPKRAQALFDAEEFARYVNHRRRCYAHWTERLEAGGAPVMTIDYCEARASDGMDRIASFLGYPSDHFGKPGTGKRNPDDILARFSNPDAAAIYLETHGLSDWAHEGTTEDA